MTCYICAKANCIGECEQKIKPAPVVLEHLPCLGMNCGITQSDQIHSAECQAEHAASIAGGKFVKRGTAQQEPVAWANKVIGGKKWLSIHASKNASDKWLEYRRKEQAQGEAYEQFALYTSPPAQQEPVASDRIIECAKRLVEHADFQLGGVLSADSKAKDIPSKAVSQVKSRHLAALRDALANTSPPPQRTWVGLTDEEAEELWESTDSKDDWELMKRTEAKLRSKNT